MKQLKKARIEFEKKKKEMFDKIDMFFLYFSRENDFFLFIFSFYKIK